MRQSSGPTASEIEDALATVLARPEFQHPEPNPLLAWWQELRDWMVNAFIDILRRLDVDVPASAAAWIFRGLLVLASVLLVLQLIRAARRREPGVQPISKSIAHDAVEAVRDPDWVALADTAAEEARFRDAVLALYQALLRRLDNAGVLRYDPAKTPGDYRREARVHPHVSSGLGRFLTLFEPVAFGGREPDRNAFDLLRAAALDAAGD